MNSFTRKFQQIFQLEQRKNVLFFLFFLSPFFVEFPFLSPNMCFSNQKMKPNREILGAHQLSLSTVFSLYYIENKIYQKYQELIGFRFPLFSFLFFLFPFIFLSQPTKIKLHTPFSVFIFSLPPPKLNLKEKDTQLLGKNGQHKKIYFCYFSLHFYYVVSHYLISPITYFSFGYSLFFIHFFHWAPKKEQRNSIKKIRNTTKNLVSQPNKFPI